MSCDSFLGGKGKTKVIVRLIQQGKREIYGCYPEILAFDSPLFPLIPSPAMRRPWQPKSWKSMTRQKLGFHHFQKARRLVWGLIILMIWVLGISIISKAVFPSSESLVMSISKHESQKSSPWVGAGRPPPYTANKHVRVVVRVHHMQDAATRSLIWSMRAQASAAQHSSPDAPRFTVDVALVATEDRGNPVVHQIAQGMTICGVFRTLLIFFTNT